MIDRTSGHLLFPLTVSAADFQPLAHGSDNMENRTGLWMCPRWEKALDGAPLPTRLYATADAVTGGVALRVEIKKGSRGTIAYENSPFPPGSAGITLYVKASENLTLTIKGVTFPATPAWRKIDIPWEKLGTTREKPSLGNEFTLGLAAPAPRDVWIIIDRLGTEGPEFSAAPALSPTRGPDPVVSTTELVGNASVLAPTVARLRGRQPFKIIAFGDSVTAGAQSFRGNWELKDDAPRFLYFSQLARLLERRYGYQGIIPVQQGRGGWTAAQAGKIVEEVLKEVGPNDVVILEFGANDLGWAGHSVETWLGNLRALIRAARAKTSQIVIMTPTTGGKVPELAAQIRRRIPEFAREEKAAYADITHWSMYRGERFAWAYLANEYHPDFLGHTQIAEILLPLFGGDHFSWPPYAKR